METLKAYLEWLHLAVEYNLARCGIETRRDDGALSTEMAVLIGAFVAIAVAGGAIFINKMQSNANAIPDSVPAPVAGGGG
jgi:hypothetical protein